MRDFWYLLAHLRKIIICDACLERHREGRVGVGDPGPGALVSNATYWLPSYFAEQRVEPQQVSEAEFLWLAPSWTPLGTARRREPCNRLVRLRYHFRITRLRPFSAIYFTRTKIRYRWSWKRWSWKRWSWSVGAKSVGPKSIDHETVGPESVGPESVGPVSLCPKGPDVDHWRAFFLLEEPLGKDIMSYSLEYLRDVPFSKKMSDSLKRRLHSGYFVC